MKEIQDKGLVKFSFYLFGVGGLLAWNAILSIMDFFIHFQGNYKPEYIYPNMNFILNVVFQFVLLFIKKRITFKTQIFYSLIISVLSMIALPMSVILLKDFNSFLFTSFIILLQGLANAISLSCFYGIISFLPFEYIISFSTGQGIAGILMNLTRYIILFSMGDPKLERNIKIGSIIFFGISAIIISLCIVFLFLVYKDPYFVYQMKHSGEFSVNDVNKYMALLSDNSQDDDSSKLANLKRDELKVNSLPEDSDFSFKYLMMQLLDLNFLIFVTYIITFSVFPGVTLAQPLFGLDESYKINTLIAIFNIFDTLGRKFPALIQMSKKTLYLVVFLRFIFLFSFPIVGGALNKSDWISTNGLSYVTIINMVIFAFTNGYVTSTTFSLAPEQVQEEIKGKSGSSISFFLIIGIFSGSTFATLVMQNFV